MKLTLYQVDAFADKVFSGNPAAVCPLESWLDDNILQAIAAENNLAETAFFIKTANGYHIRWFTPVTEVALCGHATLASAYVLFNLLGVKSRSINFQSLSGVLSVTRRDEQLTLNFPAQPAKPCQMPQWLAKAFSTSPDIHAVECLKAEDYILVFDTEQTIIDAAPDMRELMHNDLRGVIITAASNNYDFVCRFFAPNCGIDEDPVTGSAYTQLSPYWSKQLSKKAMSARQLSTRGGDVFVEDKSERVMISGKAALYMQGEIML